MVGVFVAARHQLGERLPPVGAVVVPAGEIERADRIVRRANREDARQTPTAATAARRGRWPLPPTAGTRRRGPCRRGVAAPSACGPGDLGRGRHEDDLLDAKFRQFVEQAAQRRRADRTAGASRRASRQSGANVIACGSVASGTVSAAATRRPGDRGRRRPGRPPRRAATFGLARSARRTRSRRRGSATSANTRSRRASRSCAAITQLAEAGLAEIVGQQLDVAPPRSAGAGCLSCAPPRTRSHSTAQQSRQRSARRRAARGSSRHQHGAARRRRPTTRASRGRDRQRRQPSTSSTSRGSQVGSAPGANSRLGQARGSAPARPPAPPRPTILSRKSIGKTTGRAPRPRAARRRSRATRASAHAARSQRSAARRRARATAGAPEALLVPQPLRAVDGGEQRADAPMPRPATTRS